MRDIQKTDNCIRKDDSPERAELIRFTPDFNEGLTQSQVQSRIDEGLTNRVEDEDSKWAGKIVRKNIFTYFNLIFFVLAVILLYEGSYNNLMFLIVVITNTLIGIVQEIRAKKTLDRLRIVSEPEVTVIREGRKEKIVSKKLVLDDIVIFEAGSQICADAVVCSGELTVNEALVTGESNEIKKGTGDFLLSGSFVISGIACARLEKVGSASFAAQLTRNAKRLKKRQQPGMMKSLTRLIQVIGVIIIPFGVLMFWNQYHVLGLSEKLSVENTAASLIGMIPEGLYLLTSVALAASTVRLAKKKTLVHDMKCIETLARVDVLCVDKTGTITEPEMNVEEILPLGPFTPEECNSKIRSFVRNMTADNETISTLKKYWENEPSDGKAVRIKNFSSETKYSAVEFKTQTLLLGAPEILYPEPEEPLRELLETHSGLGERILLLALYRNAGNAENDIFRDGYLRCGDVFPVALIVLSNAIRPHAKETFGYFSDQGVAIKVISGDNPVTVAMAAKNAGIPGAELYVDASSLKREELIKSAEKYTVFGRVKPEQKRILVRTLKKQGHTVAMTGDGVNDVLALKDADCGIAMASGSDAAAHVADLVLMNSDFSDMPYIVAEGRRVINNIQRSATLFLSKNIFSFILSLISLISVSLYPLKPSQISVISALMIGIPSFFLALEPNKNRIHGRFLRNVLYRALPAALTAVLIVQWTLLMTNAFEIPLEMASTMCFLLYAFSAYLMLYYACKPMNLWHRILFGAMGIIFIATLFVIPDWIQIVGLDYRGILLLVPMMFLTLPLDYILHVILEKLRNGINHAKEFLCRRKSARPEL